jgi:hypothetical protein
MRCRCSTNISVSLPVALAIAIAAAAGGRVWGRRAGAGALGTPGVARGSQSEYVAILPKDETFYEI